MGRSFHQPGMVKKNVLESDFEPLCDGTTRRRSTRRLEPGFTQAPIQDADAQAAGDHINCLELWVVHLALRQFRPLLLGKHVLVSTDNTAAVLNINRLGGMQSHRMSQLARHLLLWSPTQFKSLRAGHIPGKLNRAADALSRQLLYPESGDSIPR